MLLNHRTRPVRIAILMIALATFSAGAARAEAGARASEPAIDHFGGRGQVALDNIVGVTTEGGHLGPNMIAGLRNQGSWGATGYTGIVGYTFSDTRSSRTHTGWVSPSIDVFVTDQLSVGGTLGLSYMSGEYRMPDDDIAKGHSLAVSVVPRVGYAIALNEPITLWPRVGLGYSGARTEAIWQDEGRQSMSAFIGVVDLGLVYRPTKHVYLHVAPELVLRVASIKGTQGGGLQDSDSLQLGLTGGLGFLLNS
ncbi:hypothetical protein WME89_04825 [Sorangium sp. So ce321]|uniref:hypothetical protein n=1 Tax=Sorangium sp. So ce321 TaxID=3133300 RepID=UPI003F6477D5